MGPIKLKLSLSSASLTASAPTTANGPDTNGALPSFSPAAALASSHVNAEAGPSTPRPLLNGKGVGGTTPSTPLAATTPRRGRPPGSKTKRKSNPLDLGSTSGATGKKQKTGAKSTGTPSAARVSAIPPHVLGSASSSVSTSPLGSPGGTGMAPPPLPSVSVSPIASPSPLPPDGYEAGTPEGSYTVKEEPMDDEPLSPDPLSLPYTPDEGTEPAEGTVFVKSRTGGKVIRHKKPLKELVNKILVELRRRDDYYLFSEPVNPDEFAGYLDIVGGEDKMMDLGTMQNKNDEEQYRRMDEVEADLRMIVDAAQKFNPVGTVPYNSAVKLLNYGLKHIERTRPLVRTPAPSPTRNSATPWRDQSVLSASGIGTGRETTQPLDDVPPERYVPLEMLDFPPNSLEARAVGWNLTGGRKMYVKRDLRTRERFNGRWRRWGLDGAREVQELEEVAETFAASRTRTQRVVTDWNRLALEGEAWWEWEGYGGPTGQPPPAFSHFPVRPTLPTRELEQFDWGVYPEVESQIAEARQARKPEEVDSNRGEDEGNDGLDWLATHVRPDRPRRPKRGVRPSVPKLVYHSHYAEPFGRTSSDWLADVVGGGARGEAYRRSVASFVDGVFADVGVEEKTMAQPGSAKDEGHGVTDPFERAMRRHVAHRYNDGVLSSPLDGVATDTIRSLPIAAAQLARPAVKPEKLDAAIVKREPSADAVPVSALVASPLVHRLLTQAIDRAQLRAFLNPSEPLDFIYLFRRAVEFFREGRIEQQGPEVAMEWIGSALAGVAERSAAQRARGGGGDVDDDAPAPPWEALYSPKYPRPELQPRDHEEAFVMPALREEMAALARAERVKGGGAAAAGAAAGGMGMGSGTGAGAPVDGGATLPASGSGSASASVLGSTQVSSLARDLHVIRMEILVSAKYYPLPGVKKVSREVAERVLPPQVRHLLSVAAPAPTSTTTTTTTGGGAPSASATQASSRAGAAR